MIDVDPGQKQDRDQQEQHEESVCLQDASTERLYREDNTPRKRRFRPGGESFTPPGHLSASSLRTSALRTSQASASTKKFPEKCSYWARGQPRMDRRRTKAGSWSS